MKNKSIVTNESPAFINLQPLDISPLISSCEIHHKHIRILGGNYDGLYFS